MILLVLALSIGNSGSREICHPVSRVSLSWARSFVHRSLKAKHVDFVSRAWTLNKWLIVLTWLTCDGRIISYPPTLSDAQPKSSLPLLTLSVKVRVSHHIHRRYVERDKIDEAAWSRNGQSQDFEGFPSHFRTDDSTPSTTITNACGKRHRILSKSDLLCHQYKLKKALPSVSQ